MTQLALDTPARPPVQLRPYQEDCLSALSAYASGGGRRALVAMATGTGKTVVFSQLVAQAKRRVLIIAHQEELLRQAADKVRHASPRPLPQQIIEQATSHADPASPVVVASIQTLAVSAGRLRALDPASFSSVVVDEAHHTPASTYQQMLRHFGLVPPEPDVDWRPSADAPFLLGVTATPNRTDKVQLRGSYDDIVYSYPIWDAMRDGWLVPLRGVRVQTGADISDVRVTHGDFADGALSKEVNTPERNALAVAAYLEHAAGRPALVFCATVQHTADMAAAFRARGIWAEMVVGSTPVEERRETIAAFQRGEIEVMVGCGVFLEGFDSPRVSCLVMARPTRSSLIYTQMLGRCTRTFPEGGKTDSLVIDLVDIARKAGVQSVNTLFGLPAAVKTGGTSVMDAVDRLRGVSLPLDMVVEGTTLEDIERSSEQFDPLARATLPPRIADGLLYAWVPAGDGYALSIPQGEPGRSWTAPLVLRVSGDLLGRYHAVLGSGAEIASGSSPQEAMRLAERWAEGSPVAGALGMKRASARWHGEVATEKQAAYLRRLGGKPWENMTKGEASRLIDAFLAKGGGGR